MTFFQLRGELSSVSLRRKREKKTVKSDCGRSPGPKFEGSCLRVATPRKRRHGHCAQVAE